MISEAVAFIADQLNSYCSRHFQLDGDIVVLSGINDVSNQNNSNNQNKIIISLVNVEKDSTYLNRNPLTTANQTQTRKAPPLHLNLYIVLAANYENDRYKQGLNILSKCIQFLNASSVFDRENYPSMHKNLAKIVLEIENLNISELNSLWGVMGRHYLPSIYYKARAVAIDSNIPIERITTASTPDTTIGGR